MLRASHRGDDQKREKSFPADFASPSATMCPPHSVLSIVHSICMHYVPSAVYSRSETFPLRFSLSDSRKIISAAPLRSFPLRSASYIAYPNRSRIHCTPASGQMLLSLCLCILLFPTGNLEPLRSEHSTLHLHALFAFTSVLVLCILRAENRAWVRCLRNSTTPCHLSKCSSKQPKFLVCNCNFFCSRAFQDFGVMRTYTIFVFWLSQ